MANLYYYLTCKGCRYLFIDKLVYYGSCKLEREPWVFNIKSNETECCGKSVYFKNKKVIK